MAGLTLALALWTFLHHDIATYDARRKMNKDAKTRFLPAGIIVRISKDFEALLLGQIHYCDYVRVLYILPVHTTHTKH
jgi:hypothetical protein